MSEDPLREFHYYNDWVASIFSIISNLLLLYLILNYTTKELKDYGKILLQTCIIDLFFTVIVFITKPIIEFNQGVFFLMVIGFVSYVPHPFNYYLNLTWVLGFFFCITALPVQFFYRYMLVCRQTKLTTKVFIMLFVIAFVLAFSYTTICAIAFHPTPESQEKHRPLLNSSLWMEDGHFPIFVSSDISISPLITVFLPTTITGTCLLLRVHTSGVGIVIMSAVGWITAINPTSDLLFIKPYRIRMLQYIGCYRYVVDVYGDEGPRLGADTTVFNATTVTS